MPVVFQQPSPMAPDIAAGGGRAQVATQDFGALAGLYESQMRNQLSASQAAAQLGMQAQSHVAAMGSHQAEMGMRQQEMAAQRQAQQEGFAAQVGAQQQGRQQQAVLAEWLQGQELSQAESLHLQRLQNAVGVIRADPNLDEEQKSSAITQVMTGINPLKQRLDASRAKQEQALTEKQIQEATRIAAGQKAMDTFWSGAQDGVKWVVDPDTGERHGFLRGADGRPIQVKSDKKKAEAEDKPFDLGHAVAQAKHLAEAMGLPPPGATTNAADDAKYSAFLREEARKANYKHNDTARSPEYRFELEPDDVQQMFKAKYGAEGAAQGWEQEHRQRLLAERTQARPRSTEPTRPAQEQPTEKPSAGESKGLTEQEKKEKDELLAERDRILKAANSPERYRGNPASWSPELDAWLHRRTGL